MVTSISEPNEGYIGEVFISLSLDEQEKMSNAINMILKEVFIDALLVTANKFKTKLYNLD